MPSRICSETTGEIRKEIYILPNRERNKRVLIPSFSAFSITKMHALNIYGYVFVTDSQLCI